jgi:hypothetical protein
MKSLNNIEIAARNKANYLKAKEAFNNKRVDECILFDAAEHEGKSKQSEKGRDGTQRFLEGLHQPGRTFRSNTLLRKIIG